MRDARTFGRTGSRIQSREDFTAFASTGSPFWNFTPRLIWKSHVVGLTFSHVSARPGFVAPVSSLQVRVSNICDITLAVAFDGAITLRASGFVPSATTRVFWPGAPLTHVEQSRRTRIQAATTVQARDHGRG